MLRINLNDTIAAIATPIGEGGIGIVRLSGAEALSIADKIFVSRGGATPSGYETYTTHYGWIVSQLASLPVSQLNRTTGQPDNRPTDVIDEVILTIMRAPKSYTMEDVVEINCHGGIVPLKKVLELVLGLGARIADPGEFTKRAFLNGRIDLAQAEAVLDVIKAKTEKGLEFALLQLGGRISGYINELKEKLLDMKVHLEAAVDFPEEELSVYTLKEIKTGLAGIKKEMENFLKSFDSGRIIREGINCVICGRANVGKSSLMNELLKEERVIVTPIPGTTRDAISEYINIGGIPLNIVDTAGISKTQDPLEKEGIRRSRLWLDRADLVLFMMDANSEFSDEDKEIIESIRGKEIICVINKIDLKRRLDINASGLERYFGRMVPVAEISVLKKLNLEALLKNISDKIWKGEVSASDYNILTNARHRDSVLKALDFVEEAILSLEEFRAEEMVTISLNEAIAALGEITGASASEEVLERIFSQFCVGK